MDLIGHWREKYSTGKIRYDSQILEIRASSVSDDLYPWGTLLYSEAREQYKTQIKDDSRPTSFDLDLMRDLEFMDYGGLVVAANPSSLFEGHSVIYPRAKSSELTLRDLSDVTRLALENPGHTFIHNMENSAASILDWAHYQSYPILFPIEGETQDMVGEYEGIRISRTSARFPAYAIVAEYTETDAVSHWVARILELLRGSENPYGCRIPWNMIWRSNRVWIVPRAAKQSALAANYFGGLEMGGIFCLPNADEFRSYLPSALRREILAATLACEPETQNWFEENALRLLQK